MVLNLAVWFALHVLFARLNEIHWYGMKLEVPEMASINIPSLILTVAALIAVFKFKVNMIAVLATCAALGLVYYLISGSVS